MQIKSMFEKEIDRPFKPVIIVGQDDIYQELDEYVVTDELKKHFSEFFSVYSKGITNPTIDIGVWISGFFGSGKSHFLKILSYILDSELIAEDKTTGVKRRPIDFFKEDNKIQDNIVIADMIKSSNVSTDVVLFNIDSKSASDDSNKDKILDVFVKVFNEMRGYCTEYPFLAELEKKLDAEGLLTEFKTTFKSITDEEWEDVREDFYFISDDIVETIVKIGFMSEDAARNWADKADENYSISIEKFAEEVENYCVSKGNNHHVVFLVDEVGQYIGENTQLMLNLQTITENFGVMSHGKVWIIVTSQHNIDDIVDVKGNDFSKIQGRFKTRLSLSSANVDEIIRRRLLKKIDVAYDTLKASYPQFEPILKNNLTFTDSAEMKKFTSGDEFAAIYPFVPYQFNLLQSVLTSIRDHGAAGKSISQGERSMLRLFRLAGISVMNDEDDVLVPFYRFYDALADTLDPAINSVIIKAEKNEHLDDEGFDVKVLKTLFLIKYVKELKANLDNIAVLMISNIDEDMPALKNKIVKSLVRLEKETLIQKNTDVYSFLTNEEQDVNREIKNENVELGDILNKASQMIFYDIYPEKKFRYNNKYDFGFNKAIDQIDNGMRKNDIGIRVITPYYDFNFQSSSQSTLSEVSDDEKIFNALKGLSDDKNEVVLYLNKDFTVFREITEILQIEKYLQKHGTEIKSTLRDAKQEELRDRSSNVVVLLEKALKQSEVFVKGSKLNIPEKSVKDRMNEALGDLVSKVYHKISYMDFTPDKDDIMVAIKESAQDSISPVDINANNALNDMDNHIAIQSDDYVKPPLKSIILKFTSAPYGFLDNDVVWLVAKLFSQKRINLIMNTEIISLKTNKSEEIFKFLTGKEYREKVLLQKRKETSEEKIKTTKRILKDVFYKVEGSDNDEVIRDKFVIEVKNKLDELKDCLTYYRNNNTYPGKNVLEDARDLLMEVLSIKSIDNFYDFVPSHKKEFEDMEENTYNVLQFFKNQKNYFDEAIKTYDIFASNKNFITDEDLINIANNIHSILVMDMPYNKIKDLPHLCDEFLEKHDQIISQEKLTPQNDIKLEFDEVMEVLNEDYEYKDELKFKFETSFNNEFENLNKKLINATEISVIKGVSDEASILREKCLNKINKFKESKAPDKIPPKPKIKSVDVTVKSITSKSKVKIENEDDLNKFFDEIRLEVKNRLKENDIVNLKL